VEIYVIICGKDCGNGGKLQKTMKTGENTGEKEKVCGKPCGNCG